MPNAPSDSFSATSSYRSDPPGRCGGDLQFGAPGLTGASTLRAARSQSSSPASPTPTVTRFARALDAPGRSPQLPFTRRLRESSPGHAVQDSFRVWIQGRGWDRDLYLDQQFPTRATLDAVAPDTPVYLRRVDGHAAWANSEALRQAKISRDTRTLPAARP